MKDKNKSRIFLFIVSLVLLVGVIHGCDGSNMHENTSLSSDSSVITSISTTDEVTSTGGNTSLSSEATTNIEPGKELIKLSIYSNEKGDIGLHEMSTSGMVPRNLSLTQGLIKTDGSVNHISVSYNLDNKTVEVSVNDIRVYKNSKAIRMDIDAIKIESSDESYGVIVLNNLVINGDESVKSRNFYSISAFDVIPLETMVSSREDKTLTVSFNYAVVQRSALGLYDKITLILGVSS